jgi:hypothetical protein
MILGMLIPPTESSCNARAQETDCSRSFQQRISTQPFEQHQKITGRVMDTPSHFEIFAEVRPAFTRTIGVKLQGTLRFGIFPDNKLGREEKHTQLYK